MQRIAIIGGGASGLVASIYASDLSHKVTVFEGNEESLKKVLMTGNGRCNYWNEDMATKHYHSSDEAYLSSIFTKENQEEILNFFERLGIVPKIKNGYYYPFSNQALSIKKALLNEAFRLGVEFKTNYRVQEIKKVDNQFVIDEFMFFDKVILATGGKSYPKTGSDGFGWELARFLGHTIKPIYPSLVALKVNTNVNSLWSGVRSEVEVSLYENGEYKAKQHGEIQFTNYGVSGICIFNLSGYVAEGLGMDKKEEIRINFMPFLDKEEVGKWFESKGKLPLGVILNGFLNEKIIKMILKKSKLDQDDLYSHLSLERQEKLWMNLTEFRLMIEDTLDYDSAQVCKGGISLSEVDCSTMQSHLVDGLFFAGEILDVDGDCGGYNLGFAWISGMLAGKGVKNDSDSTNKSAY